MASLTFYLLYYSIDTLHIPTIKFLEKTSHLLFYLLLLMLFVVLPPAPFLILTVPLLDTSTV